MKFENINSKKTAVIAASLCAMLAIGGSMAYFTDKDNAENKITVGEVKIDLTEPTWDSHPDDNKNSIPDPAEDLVPLDKVKKDPMVTNKGKNDAYVFVKVSVPKANIYTAQEDGTKNPRAVTQLFTFTPDTANWELLESSTADANVNTYVYGYKSILKPEEKTTKLFEEVTFVNAIEGQGLENSTQNINIQAYGIQSDNTGTLAEAYAKYCNQNA